MSLYSGFFNAQETGGVYDRTYDADDLVEYFARFVGSGVCVSDNADSFKVTLSGRTATVAPGYLFIQGYWLKSDASYPIMLPTSGTYAILAHLDTTNRAITLEYQAVAQTYVNALCLASVNVDTQEVVDTRDDATICGIIEDSGDVTAKAQVAQEYVNSTIPNTLSTLRTTVNAAAANVNAAAEDVAALVPLLETPPVGEIRYFASQPDTSKWLVCDGRYVNPVYYPQLWPVLAKAEIRGAVSIWNSATTSGGYYSEDATQVSNAVIFGGYLYFVSLHLGYSNSATLHRVTLSNATPTVTDITLNTVIWDEVSDVQVQNRYLGTSRNPMCLSVCYYGGRTYFFISQQVWPERLNRPMVTIASFTLSGTAVSNIFNQSALTAYSISESSGYPALPYVYMSGGYWYYALCAKCPGAYDANYWQGTIVRCSVLPISGNTISSSSYTKLTYSTATAPLYHRQALAAFGYSPLNTDAPLVAGAGRWIYTSTGHGNVSGGYYTARIKACTSSPAASYEGKYTNVNYGSDDVDDDGATINPGDDGFPGSNDQTYLDGSLDYPAQNLPVYGGGYMIGGIRLGGSGYDTYPYLADRIIAVPVLEVSSKKMYTIHVDKAASPYARIFPHSVLYAESYFFVFVGCGVYYSSTPTDESSWQYASTVSTVGCIIRNGGLAFDASNTRMYIFGLNEDLCYVLKYVPIGSFIGSGSSDIALPTATKGNIQGYIKAVSG